MAAEGEARLVVRLVDKASAGLKSLSGGIKLLKTNWLAVTAVLGTVIAAIVSSIKAFSEQEDAVNKLNLAIKNQGINIRGYSEGLQELANELQRTTAFSDESIIQTQALLTTFGLAGKELKQTTKAALDLSAAMGIDLHTASLLLGKAWQGQTEALSRYGIKISEAIPQGERFAAVLGTISSRFGGSAQAQLNTFSGKVGNLKNQFSELKEKMGEELMPVAEAWIRWIQKGLGLLNALTSGVETHTKAINKNEAALERAVNREREQVRVLELQGATSRGELIRRFLLIEKLSSALEKFRKLNGEAMAAPIVEPESRKTIDEEAAKAAAEDEKRKEEEMLRDAQAAQAKIDRATLTQEELALKETESLELRLLQQGQFDILDDLRAANKLAQEKERSKQRVAIAADTFSRIGSLATANSKELAAIGKAANIANATMDTYAAANRALAQGGFFGFAMAAAVIAAGLANVAKISSVPLAHGGVVLPTGGGTIARIGEAGRAEAVIPLGDDRAGEMIRNTIGGDTFNLTLNIGTLTGDRQSVQELARVIDEELFRMGRNRKSVFQA